MKRILALILALCLCLPLAACDSAGNGGDDLVGSGAAKFEGVELEDINKDDLERFKIAFTYGSFEDKLGGQFRACIQYLCDAYNCEAVFFSGGMSGEDNIAAWESTLVAGDIDGLLSCGTISAAMMAVADKYNVPVVSVCSFPTQQVEIDNLCAYEGYLGAVVDDDVWAGQRMVESLYDAGCRNITWSGLTLGLAGQHDDRDVGVKATYPKYSDLNILTEAYSMGQWAQDVATFNASFPNIDGMMFSALGDAIYLALETEGMADGSVKIAGVDISSQTGAYFENGVQVWTCGGQYATAMVCWTILYNYLSDGTIIIEDTKVPMRRPYMEITSYDDYVNYVKYVEAPVPVYNAQEMTQLLHIFNADVTAKDYQALADKYTLADAISRRS